MPERPPAMQGELWVEETARPRLPFTVGEALDAGLGAMRKRWLVLTLAQILASLPGAGLELAVHYGLAAPRLFSRAYFERTLLLAVAGSVLAALFRGGIASMALAAARGAEPSLGDLVRGMRHFPAMLALELAQLVLLVVSVPLLFVPYSLVWTGLALAPFALVDRDATLWGAVRWSWETSRGERWHLFGFLAATAVIAYLGVVACCVGTFPAAALTSVATAHVYRRLDGEA